MVDWKLYIDSPQKRAFDLCEGSLTACDGAGCGYDTILGDETNCSDGYGDGWGYGFSDGYGDGYGWCDGDGGSSTEW